MTTIIAYILSIMACAFVLYPLLRKSRDVRTVSLTTRQRELSDLQWQSDRIQITLRDLELDYQTGKLSQDDYNELAEDQNKKLRQVDQRTQTLIGIDGKHLVQGLEKEIAAQRKVHDQIDLVKTTCPPCGHPLRKEDKFCPNCENQIKKS